MGAQPGNFNFLYRYPQSKLNDYIYFEQSKPPQGILIDFVEDRKEAFQRVFESVNIQPSVQVPPSASLDRFAVIKPKTHISDNVLVAQRAYLQNAWMGKGANAQENCYIINSRLEGFNVTAHGAKNHRSRLGATCICGVQQLSQRTAGLSPVHRLKRASSCPTPSSISRNRWPFRRRAWYGDWSPTRRPGSQQHAD